MQLAAEAEASRPSPAEEAVPTGSPGHESPGLEEQVRRIVELYRQAGRALRSADPPGLAEGVTMSQMRVLYFLGRAGPASVSEVAAGVDVSQPSATETLERLVRAGFVEQRPDSCDRRIVRNVLTPAGWEMLDRPWETRRAVLANALRSAAPEEREAIARGLELLCAALAQAERQADEAAHVEAPPAKARRHEQCRRDAQRTAGEH